MIIINQIKIENIWLRQRSKRIKGTTWMLHFPLQWFFLLELKKFQISNTNQIVSPLININHLLKLFQFWKKDPMKVRWDKFWQKSHCFIRIIQQKNSKVISLLKIRNVCKKWKSKIKFSSFKKYRNLNKI